MQDESVYHGVPGSRSSKGSGVVIGCSRRLQTPSNGRRRESLSLSTRFRRRDRSNVNRQSASTEPVACLRQLHQVQSPHRKGWRAALTLAELCEHGSGAFWPQYSPEGGPVYLPDEHRRRDRAPRSRLAKEHIGSKNVPQARLKTVALPHSRHSTSIHTKRKASCQDIDAWLTRLLSSEPDHSRICAGEVKAGQPAVE